jgi:methyltransferase (TIGR00027 family)
MRNPLRPRDLHTTDRPSSTAQWTTLARALELLRPPGERIVDDPYAPVFLTSAAQGVLRSLRHGLPVVHSVERRELAGISAYALCRHRFIDEHQHEAFDDGAEQLLILGAGYDSRAYRFADELSGRPVHEVDLPPLSRRKAKIVETHPELFGHTRIRRVEIDFRTQSLAEQLLESGFSVGARTYVVWEGVSLYLSESAVRDTLTTLREMCGPGTVLAMDFWDGTGGTGRLAPARRLGARAIALVGEPVTFGVAPDLVGDLLGAHGFTVLDQAAAEELTARYATDGRTSAESLYVLTARL